MGYGMVLASKQQVQVVLEVRTLGSLQVYDVDRGRITP